MILNKQVLDHGYVKLHNIAGHVRRIDEMFDAADTDPANVARMSFNQKDIGRTENEDMKLADYLMRNWHTTPFEVIEIWLEMKLPIFVARQFVRHRTTSLNEVSGRYVVLPEEWYIPEIVHFKAENKKQGHGGELDLAKQEYFKNALNAQCSRSYELYKHYLELGVAPEEARMFLHLNHYTIWMWKQNLHNLMHFLSLRSDNHAQDAAREYADAIIAIIRGVLPRTMDLFDKYRRFKIG